jgi:anti-sigma regulatory factor (Ser/Thr protein kinase)
LKATHISALQPADRRGLRLESACDFSAVREAALFARNWLASQRLSEAELGAWELALVEAGNNAVEHAADEARKMPVIFELALGETEVEARIIDHTPGFALPEPAELPDLDSEGGRGLFLIKSLTDHVAYVRGQGENQMILRKRRDRPAGTAAPDMKMDLHADLCGDQNHELPF